MSNFFVQLLAFYSTSPLACVISNTFLRVFLYPAPSPLRGIGAALQTRAVASEEEDQTPFRAHTRDATS